MKVYNIYKKVGQTPLEALEALRKKAKIPLEAKLTYAGRLDPMASGVLLILQGATQAQREKYMGLPKKYRAKIVLGFGTDSFDLLGMPVLGAAYAIDDKFVNQVLKSLIGKITLPIPPYSSVIYKGRPLFMSAREGKIIEKNLPKREMEIKAIKYLSKHNISSARLLKYIESSIKKVKGDFRQKEILQAWKKILEKNKNKYIILEIEVSCGSGTYIRSIANSIGERLGTKAVLYCLERFGVGKYAIKKALR